ncbi:hypothetical protein BT96DRAFT_1021693 [Gymnopus androsaceus JB14]|uniref:NAD(P)-binding protein n=1 Tax=Gymnopus androsaceus JB14 TaxID=1447944 RepID=A0A6A4HDB0_9AGAR|nr:hypothetical protein BT96DRAFT_1021693 [Gymnopus androsaceus JB14]
MSIVVRAILVTGSNTGIGYNLVQLRTSKGHTVYLASSFWKGNPEKHNLDTKFVQLDVTDTKSIQAAKETVEKEEG